MKSLPPSQARLLQTMAAILVAGASAGSPAAEADAWTVIGEQGLVRFVLVPQAQAANSAAYAGQIANLCEPNRTCFLNFYTNSTGAPLGMPLPEAIANEATAIYRRSMKTGVQLFRLSCRLKIAGEECF